MLDQVMSSTTLEKKRMAWMAQMAKTLVVYAWPLRPDLFRPLPPTSLPRHHPAPAPAPATRSSKDRPPSQVRANGALCNGILATQLLIWNGTERERALKPNANNAP